MDLSTEAPPPTSPVPSPAKQTEAPEIPAEGRPTATSTPTPSPSKAESIHGPSPVNSPQVSVSAPASPEKSTSSSSRRSSNSSRGSSVSSRSPSLERSNSSSSRKTSGNESDSDREGSLWEPPSEMQAGTHKCSQCMRKFKTPTLLREHVKVHSDQTNLKCGECGKIFMKPILLRRHMNVHASEADKFKCERCNKLFSHKKTLDKHGKVCRNSGTNVIIGACDSCGSQFTNPYAFKHHQTFCQRTKKKFVCSHEGCSKSYLHNKDLLRHQRAQHQEK